MHTSLPTHKPKQAPRSGFQEINSDNQVRSTKRNHGPTCKQALALPHDKRKELD